jgi:anti-sigma B factor antagonist
VTELVVHFSTDGDRSVLTLAGELDLETAAELRTHAQAELAAGRCQVLTIDMSGLTFVDSSGLGLLVELRQMATASGVALELANVPPRPARVIEIAGLADTLGLASRDPQPEA